MSSSLVAKRIFLAFALVFVFSLQFSVPSSAFAFSVTGTTTNPEINQENSSNLVQTSLRDFSSKVKNGWVGVPTGIFVPGVMAFPIVQQPTNNAAFVSSQADTLTQFRMASQYNSTGILAHDYLAGVRFTELIIGQEVAVIYGDGTMRFFRIYEIQKYQAITPTSPYSNFVDLSNNNKISAETLFYRTYGLGGGTLVFQTCISTEKVSSWGRLFILARPSDNPTLSLAQILPNIEKAFASVGKVLAASQILTASR